MEQIVNAYHIKVNKCCASCKHKESQNDGTRQCTKTGQMVEKKSVCPEWEMNDGLRNAGLQKGAVVRLKGTQEIVIR